MKKAQVGGFSLIELIIVIAIVAVIAALVRPCGGFFQVPRSANGASAQQTLRTLHTAQVHFAEGIGKGNYSSQIGLLTTSFDRESGIFDNFEYPKGTSLVRQGFVFGPIKIKPATATAPAKFTCIARPLNTRGKERTGNDTFFIDETGVIRHSGSARDWPDGNSDPVQ